MNVSVVIPVYNNDKGLEMVLKELKPQLTKGDEIILGNDGGDKPHKTWRLLEEYKGKAEIGHYWQPRNGYGRIAAINMCVVKAQNDCIVSIDGDCVPASHLIASIKQGFRDDILLCGRIDRICPVKGHVLDYRLYNGGQPTQGWSYIYAFGGNLNFSRNKALEIGLFDEWTYGGQWGAGDTDFGLRMHLAGYPSVFHNHALVFHNEHERVHLNKANGGARNRGRFTSREIQFLRDEFQFLEHTKQQVKQMEEKYDV